MKLLTWASAGKLFNLRPFEVRRVILLGGVRRHRGGVGRSLILDEEFREALRVTRDAVSSSAPMKMAAAGLASRGGRESLDELSGSRNLR